VMGIEFYGLTSCPKIWAKCNLGEIATKITKGATPTTYGFSFLKNGINFIKVENISNNCIDLKGIRDFISEEAHYCQKKSTLEENDVLFSIAGTIGNTCIITKEHLPANTNQALAIIGGYSNIVVPKLLQIQLSSFITDATKAKARGGAMNNISLGDLKNLEILIPPLPEQHEIVSKIEELFSELDNGVESLKKAREQLKTYRQAVLKYAFEGKLTQEWREQQIEAGNPPEPAEKLLERIKKEREAHYQKQVEEWQKACEQAKTDGNKKPAKPREPKDLPPLMEKELAELPELPVGWGWSYLDCFGYWTGGGTPSKQRKEYWLDGNVLWISPKDMKNQYIKLTIDKITKTAVKESSAKFIPSGSVLFVVRSGILRRTLPISITTEISTINQDLQAFTFFIVSPEYVYWYCVANEFHIRNKCAKSGTTVESIETTQLKKYRISLCSPEEQQAIVQEIETRLSVCDQLEQTIEDSLKKSEALRQSILKKAFEGELTREWRLAHPELISGENSAESLLERIRAEKDRLNGEGTKRRSGKIRKK
jgi:type I restriction enzyme, S subunit